MSNISINIVFEDISKQQHNKAELKGIKLDSNDKIFTKTQLEALCQGNNMEKCAFNIRVVNSDEVSKDQQKQGKAKSAVFYLAVENYRGENVLFEGIPIKAITDKISTTTSNNYFYYIFEDNKSKDIEILLTSQTASTYKISAKVISNSAFIKDTNQNLYPKYNET